MKFINMKYVPREKKIENDILNQKRHFCNGEQYIMLYTGSFLNIMYASVPHKNYYFQLESFYIELSILMSKLC